MKMVYSNNKFALEVCLVIESILQEDSDYYHHGVSLSEHHNDLLTCHCTK